MGSIARFLPGIGVTPPRSLLANLPAVPGSRQVLKVEDFVPYRAGDFTLTQTNGTTAAFAWNCGAVQLSTTGSTAGDRMFLSLPTSAWQIVQGNQSFMDTKIAIRGSAAVGNANDTNMFCGWFNTADPATATDGLYFLKPSGGYTVNFIVKKGGTTTTFQNVADLSKPSGIVNDAASSAGTLAGTISGNALTAVSIGTGGGGYQSAPIVIHTTAAGTLGTVYVQLGSTSFFGNPSLPANLTQLTYGALYAPYITAAGSGYTNGAASFDVCALHDLQIYFDGKGRLIIGINGRATLSIGGSAVEIAPTAMVPGQTYNLASAGVGPNFSTIGTQLSTSVAPVQPALGSFLNVSPLTTMQWITGIGNTTANARAMFIDEVNLASELN